MLKLSKADAITEELEELLGPHCHSIRVAGSVRRRRPVVRDIDFVAIPIWGTLKPQISEIADRILRSGPKWSSFIYKGVQVDVYYATEETWATLLLIKTGSKESNIRLCTLAKNRGWHLAANGEGSLARQRNLFLRRWGSLTWSRGRETRWRGSMGNNTLKEGI